MLVNIKYHLIASTGLDSSVVAYRSVGCTHADGSRFSCACHAGIMGICFLKVCVNWTKGLGIMTFNANLTTTGITWLVGNTGHAGF